MRIEFHANGQTPAAGLREYAEICLRRAFRRFAGRVRRVSVHVWDVNGPRGGVDQGVRLIVELSPSGEVLVKETDSNAFVALTEAASRGRHAVRKELRRRWDGTRRAAQRAREARHRAGLAPVASL